MNYLFSYIQNEEIYCLFHKLVNAVYLLSISNCGGKNIEGTAKEKNILIKKAHYCIILV